QYGEDITDTVFYSMISQITKGSYTLLQRWHDKNIIKKLCELFSSKINTKVIDRLVKDFSIYSCPIEDLKCILDTGYKFTEKQIENLYIKSYNIHEIVD